MHLKKKLLASVMILGSLIVTTQAADVEAESIGASYSVKTGDNLYRIALNHNVSLEDLVEINQLDKADCIHPSQTIIIPEKETTAPKKETVKATTARYGTDLTDAQHNTLLAIVQQESGGRDYEAILAVVSVMTNRVDSGDYQDSIWGVATASGQFEAYGAGHYTRHIGAITEETRLAVKDGLEGKKNVSTLNFWTDDYAEARGVTGVNIGGNIFFNL